MTSVETWQRPVCCGWAGESVSLRVPLPRAPALEDKRRHVYVAHEQLRAVNFFSCMPVSSPCAGSGSCGWVKGRIGDGGVWSPLSLDLPLSMSHATWCRALWPSVPPTMGSIILRQHSNQVSVSRGKHSTNTGVRADTLQVYLPRVVQPFRQSSEVDCPSRGAITLY